MTLTTRRPVLVWSSAAAIALLATLLAVALTAGASQRGSVYSQLERPATPAAVAPDSVATVGPGPVAASIHAGSYRLSLTIAPNRAAGRSRLAVVVRRGATAVKGARVTITYSMPAMGMDDVFTGRLPQTAGGSYGALQPVFGMPGIWQLRLAVAPPDGTKFTVAINDHMIR